MAGQDSAHRRARMVERDLRARGIRSPGVLAAFVQVPRELFVPPQRGLSPYADRPIPIACGQTTSQPYIIARMMDLAEVDGARRVLEVGTGSGYQTALLSLTSEEVVSIERFDELARAAGERLAALECANVRILLGDGTLGAAEFAPFDAILVSAAAPDVPPPLLDQLAEGGRLVLPVGPRGDQALVRLRRTGEAFHREHFDPCRFLPLIGRHGFTADEHH